MADGWTIAAAAGTTLSAVFVGWQAYETRRATTTNRRALLASEAVAIEGARARMDQHAPRVEVTVRHIDWPPLEPSAIGDQSQPQPAGRKWHFPRDTDQYLTLRARVLINNLDDRSVHVSLEDTFLTPTKSALPETGPLLLLREEMPYIFDASFPVSQWAENWRAHLDGRPLPTAAEGKVICRDDSDRGVVDTWRLRLTGWPIQPVPDQEGLWQVTAPQQGQNVLGCIEFDLQPPRVRTYWLSRSQNIPLPEAVYGESRRRLLRRVAGKAFHGMLRLIRRVRGRFGHQV